MLHPRRPFLISVLALLAFPAVAAAVADTVPQYGTYEVRVPVGTVDSGDWVSDADGVSARMTCPSGRTVEVPAFLTRDFHTENVRGQVARSSVRLLKIYFDEADWRTPARIDCALADVRLVDTRSGREARLAGNWSAIGCRLDVEPPAAPGDARTLRMQIDLDSPPVWPGALIDVGGADWSEFDELRFAMKVETPAMVEPVRAEYVTSSGSKIKAGWDLTGYAPSGQWGEFVWRFHEPPPETRVETVPDGPPYYAFRLLPEEVGEHRVQVLRDGRTVEERRFTCVAGKLPRPIRVSAADPAYFETVDGKPWLAVGENVCWYGGGQLEDYEEWLARLHDAGANYCRIWMPPWCFALEWETLGDYRLDRAWELDRVLALARKYGIHVMLCLEWHGSYREEDSWWDNPYYSGNGGPCGTPRAFFTDALARELFRRRLAYIVARYSAYGNILSWELFNEVNLVDGYDRRVVAPWHEEMAHFLRQIDPYRHLITTSYSGPKGDPAVWRLADIDYVQAHDYTTADWGDNGRRWVEYFREDLTKPMLFGEAGIDHSGKKTAEMDPAGISLHNALWSTVFGGGAGTAMTWWWDSYVHPRGLYRHFASVASFARGVNWTQGLEAMHSPEPLFAPGADRRVRGVVEIRSDNESWDPAPFNEPNTFAVADDGTVADEDRLSKLLHGTENHRELQNPQTFILDCPADAEFIVEVHGVSGWGGAALNVTVDGDPAVDEWFYDYSTRTGTIHTFDGAYRVPLTSGRHEIVVSNPGPDWADVSYVIVNDWVMERPPVRVIGLAGPQDVMVWVQNKGFNRRLVEELEIEPARLRGVLLDLSEIPIGDYAVTVYDTWSGKELSRGRILHGPTRPLRLPPFSRALALRLHRLDP